MMRTLSLPNFSEQALFYTSDAFQLLYRFQGALALYPPEMVKDSKPYLDASYLRGLFEGICESLGMSPYGSEKKAYEVSGEGVFVHLIDSPFGQFTISATGKNVGAKDFSWPLIPPEANAAKQVISELGAKIRTTIEGFLGTAWDIKAAAKKFLDNYPDTAHTGVVWVKDSYSFPLHFAGDHIDPPTATLFIKQGDTAMLVAASPELETAFNGPFIPKEATPADEAKLIAWIKATLQGWSNKAKKLKGEPAEPVPSYSAPSATTASAPSYGDFLGSGASNADVTEGITRLQMLGSVAFSSGIAELFAGVHWGTPKHIALRELIRAMYKDINDNNGFFYSTTWTAAVKSKVTIQFKTLDAIYEQVKKAGWIDENTKITEVGTAVAMYLYHWLVATENGKYVCASPSDAADILKGEPVGTLFVLEGDGVKLPQAVKKVPLTILKVESDGYRQVGAIKGSSDAAKVWTADKLAPAIDDFKFEGYRIVPVGQNFKSSYNKDIIGSLFVSGFPLLRTLPYWIGTLGVKPGKPLHFNPGSVAFPSPIRGSVHPANFKVPPAPFRLPVIPWSGAAAPVVAPAPAPVVTPTYAPVEDVYKVGEVIEDDSIFTSFDGKHIIYGTSAMWPGTLPEGATHTDFIPPIGTVLCLWLKGSGSAKDLTFVQVVPQYESPSNWRVIQVAAGAAYPTGTYAALSGDAWHKLVIKSAGLLRAKVIYLGNGNWDGVSINGGAAAVIEELKKVKELEKFTGGETTGDEEDAAKKAAKMKKAAAIYAAKKAEAAATSIVDGSEDVPSIHPRIGPDGIPMPYDPPTIVQDKLHFRLIPGAFIPDSSLLNWFPQGAQITHPKGTAIYTHDSGPYWLEGAYDIAPGSPSLLGAAGVKYVAAVEAWKACGGAACLLRYIPWLGSSEVFSGYTADKTPGICIGIPKAAKYPASEFYPVQLSWETLPVGSLVRTDLATMTSGGSDLVRYAIRYSEEGYRKINVDGTLGSATIRSPAKLASETDPSRRYYLIKLGRGEVALNEDGTVKGAKAWLEGAPWWAKGIEKQAKIQEAIKEATLKAEVEAAKLMTAEAAEANKAALKDPGAFLPKIQDPRIKALFTPEILTLVSARQDIPLSKLGASLKTKGSLPPGFKENPGRVFSNPDRLNKLARTMLHRRNPGPQDRCMVQIMDAFGLPLELAPARGDLRRNPGDGSATKEEAAVIFGIVDALSMAFGKHPLSGIDPTNSSFKSQFGGRLSSVYANSGGARPETAYGGSVAALFRYLIMARALGMWRNILDPGERTVYRGFGWQKSIPYDAINDPSGSLRLNKDSELALRALVDAGAIEAPAKKFDAMAAWIRWQNGEKPFIRGGPGEKFAAHTRDFPSLSALGLPTKLDHHNGSAWEDSSTPQHWNYYQRPKSSGGKWKSNLPYPDWAAQLMANIEGFPVGYVDSVFKDYTFTEWSANVYASISGYYLTNMLGLRSNTRDPRFINLPAPSYSASTETNFPSSNFPGEGAIHYVTTSDIPLEAEVFNMKHARDNKMFGFTSADSGYLRDEDVIRWQYARPAYPSNPAPDGPCKKILLSR